MKSIYTLTMCLALLMLTNRAEAQLFGQDVKINPSDTTQENEVQIDVAFNGWLFAVHKTWDSTTNSGGLSIRKSTDNGATWTGLDAYAAQNSEYTQLDMVVAGTDTNALTIFVAGVNHNISSGNYILFVDRYNGTTGHFLGSILNHPTSTRPIYDIALATDYKFPSVGTTPYSLGLVYSCYSSTYDSINFYCSTNGGTSFLPSVNIAKTGSYFRNVAIDIGRSVTASNGRYFVAWEQIASGAARTGHIFTSRNQSTVAGPFTAPVNLDSLSTTMINLCRNPKIAVQSSLIDNDSSSVTAIVTVDRDYIGDGSDYDLLGFYNKRAHYTDNWYRFDVVNSGEKDMQSDVTYDPTNNNFLLTYLDSTNHKLPLASNEFNLAYPSTWNVISNNYVNHNQVLGNAFPKVVVNPANNQAALAWVKNENGKNTAYFDAQYSTVQPVVSLIQDTICMGDSALFNGTYYKLYTTNVSGDTTSAFNGVDSFALFNLFVNNLPVPVIGASGNVLSTGLFSAYQWQLSHVDISAATAQSFTAPASGTYSVVVTDANGCKGESAPISVSVVSVNETPNELALKVYPNPVATGLYFDLGTLNQVDILLTDLQGQVVISKAVLKNESLDVKDLAAGVYLLKVSNGNRVQTLQIQKQ